MNGKIAVIGDKDTVLVFKAVGASVYFDTEHDDIKKRILELEEKEYGIIFITDSCFAKMEEFLKSYDQKPYPIIIPIPDVTGKNEDYSIQKIFRNMEKAVGSAAALKGGHDE